MGLLLYTRCNIKMSNKKSVHISQRLVGGNNLGLELLSKSLK